MKNYFFRIFYALLLLLLLTLGSTLGLTVEPKCIEREKEALLKFKESVLDNSGILSTWRDDVKDGDCCNWKRVECSKVGHVQKLDLRGGDFQYLQGTINFTSLTVLQNMEYLDLSYNYFLGSSIFEHIFSLTKLRYLNLSDSGFGGRIPYQIGNLFELEYLDLSESFDGMNGEIPSQLGNLTRLTYLNLRNNKNIIGKIPCQLRNLSQLQYLDLQGTYLDGFIPFQVEDLSILQTLKLDVSNLPYNSIKWLSTLTNLTSLSLKNQSHRFVLSHYLLQTIQKFCPKLIELRLNGFHLVDYDVEFLFHSYSNFSTSPTILDFSNNTLTSSTFQFLSNVSHNLRELYLSYNKIVLSSHLYPNYPSLVVLDLSYNNLTSSQFLVNLNFTSKLQELLLSNCSLTDSSYPVLSTYNLDSSSSLLILDLSSNLLISTKIFFWVYNFTTNLQTLDLSDNHLQGEIPPFFRNMCTLKEFNLSNNSLSGDVSNFIQTCCNRHILWRFNLSHNRITGVLPKNISFLTKLESLNLVGNSLEGEINESHLNNFSMIKSLALSYNTLSLKFSSSWIPPFQLTTLRLASCKLDSNFPTWLKTQRFIMRLDISDSKLNDEVPKWFWNNSQHMKLMNMSHNNLIGTIPNFPFKLQQNPVIILNSNQFEGEVPSFLLQASHLILFENKFSHLFSFLCDKVPPMTSLTTLDLSNNQIEGQLPDCWKSINTLFYLDLSNNKISGKIPQSMGTLVKLKALVLRNNTLNGELPSTLKSCDNLILLDVGENKLSGQIPSWIGENMQELIILSMTQNQFYGNIPYQLCYLRKIQFLDLSINNLSEGIPTCLENFTTLSERNINAIETESRIYPTGDHYVYVYASGINYYLFSIPFFWKGMERGFKQPETRLKSIDLSSNKLTGEIPKKIGYLVGLVSLNLSRNHLSGEIPNEIGNLVSLDFLDLSRNKFSGKIPPTLSKIDRLAYLDLSNNMLRGRIPFGRQLQTLDPLGFEGNLDLCGAPLVKLCPPDVMVTDVANSQGTEIHNEDENSVFYEGFYMSLGLGYFFGFWGLIGPLLLWLPWRITYLRFLNKLIDYLMAINLAKFHTFFKA